MKATKTWILIADGARARIMLNKGPGKGLTPVLDDEMSASRAPTREIVSDKPGRLTKDGRGIEPRVDWHRFEKHRFAGAMARIISDAGQRRAFDRLVLIAPPEPLGALRAKLEPPVRRLVTKEIGKDFTNLSLHELKGRLSEFLIL